MVGNYFVYILRCGDGSLYTGSTNDIEKRLAAHASGKGAKYTRGRGPLAVVYTEAFKTKSEALKVENQIKALNRGEKMALIERKKRDEPEANG
ncbi:hypothetical protein DCC39_07625 [Pueribacillus theae]|uniref:GIY-YIG domain-containing protein n=1 Tax=Pueribacillus theae TaxID=2171751 RepID=A0A2U1K578_9BACI|nr:GIY-YIG nuclease family protein [Pueribacillus theae]PWA12108.1 hypothetical protein DCC39_07625 [Pueribacillus theae]